jgi:hypothetical protein
MSETYTGTGASTYTEARAAAVMLSVLADLGILAAASMVSYPKAKTWMEDLLYLAIGKVLKSFELQVYSPNMVKVGGYKYALSDNGSLIENSLSGGIDPYDWPAGYTVGLFADVDWTKSNKNQVSAYLASRGWGMNGSSMGGQLVYERAYSKDGYGLVRHRINL